ncbi:LytR C-terminal domain-containing protein [Aeromicrobium fastidiosum]|nr:LytR C-terminal domain-containing protein [Aeromicrobium fastidiosum]
MAHRKNVPAPRAFVPSSWFIVLTVMVVIGGAGWLGWLLVDDDPAAPADTAAPVASATPTPADESPTPADESPTPADESPTPADESPTPAGESPTPADESPTPADESPTPADERTAPVSVLNNSGVVGAARAFSAKVTSTGWTLGGVGNWTGSIPSNTVYYPPGLQAQAELLAADVGIARVRPSVSPMRTDRLTIILSGTQ